MALIQVALRCAAVGTALAALCLSLPVAEAQGAKHRQHGPPAGAGAAQARREIEADYRSEDAAFSHLDADGVFAFFAPDCELIDSHGQSQDLGTMRKGIEDYFRQARLAQSKTVITQFSLDKGGATVTSRTVTQLDIVRPAGVGHLVSTSTGRDFWAKTGEGWRIKRSRDLSETVTVNGHHVPA